LLAAGVCPSSSFGHLSWFLFQHFVSLALDPLGQGPRGNPCSHCRGIALCGVEEGPRASPSPVGNQSSCLFRGRPPKYRKIQQEDFQGKCHPLPRCQHGGKARGAGGWLQEVGLPWLARSDLTRASTGGEPVVDCEG